MNDINTMAQHLVSLLQDTTVPDSKQVNVYLQYALACNDAMVHYYVGMLLDKCGRYADARKRYVHCHKLCPTFTHATFQLANGYIRDGEYDNVVKWLRVNYGRRTLDPRTGKSAWNVNDQMQMMTMLVHQHMQCGDLTATERVIRVARRILAQSRTEHSQSNIQWYITMGRAMGDIHVRHQRADLAYTEYHDALTHALSLPTSYSRDTLHALQSIVHGMGLIMYMVDMPDIAVFVTWMTRLYPYMSVRRSYVHHAHITVAYMSPDINKNAVSLFCAPLFTHYDKTRFRVIILYTNAGSDEFTEYFKTCPVHWVDISCMTDDDVLSITSTVDVLVDLIACGSGHRMSVCQYANVPVVINYLGYPGTAGTPIYTHRIVDTITDTITDTQPIDSVTLVEHPLVIRDRAFICFQMHPHVTIPPFRCIGDPIKDCTGSNHTRYVRIGIMQRGIKITHAWIRYMNAFVDSYKDVSVVFYLKRDEPSNHPCEWDRQSKTVQLKAMHRYLPFRPILTEYLDDYNYLDICIDTYPYSGTTTTCCSLLMGIPVFTIFNPNHHHASRTTTSILKHAGLDEYICTDVDDMHKRMYNWIQQWNSTTTEQHIQHRRDIHHRFTSSMNPVAFMHEYEGLITTACGSI